MAEKNYEIEKGNRYDDFERMIKENFSEKVNDTKIFLTDASNLWDDYINNIPEAFRQHYNCNGCRHFINHYGTLVTIDDNGEIKSLLWDLDLEEVPLTFRESVKIMNNKVKKSKIRDVFISDKKTLGLPVTGDWTHLHCYIPERFVNRSRLKNASQVAAAKYENFKMLKRALDDYSKRYNKYRYRTYQIWKSL